MKEIKTDKEVILKLTEIAMKNTELIDKLSLNIKKLAAIIELNNERIHESGIEISILKREIGFMKLDKNN